MIAGEYAVLEKRHTLVAMAVDRFVYATIHPGDEQRLELENLDLHNVSWGFHKGKVVFGSKDKRLHFVHQAMEVTLCYLREQEINVRPFSLSVRSELDDASGVKYGLGSSAAVTTSVVAAILHAHLQEAPAKDLLFRLAVVAHVRTQGTGSGADIAASVYGGMIEYTSPQADWLLAADEDANSITELIASDWPYASVKEVNIPENIHIYVGWTGTPASTVRLVDKILLLKKNCPQALDSFLASSEASVQLFLRGMHAGDVQLVFQGIEKNRQTLARLGEDAQVPVETPLLRRLSEVAQRCGGAGKLSGAGGGDCGIAFLASTSEKDMLFKQWTEEHIQPLHIQVSKEGAIRL